MATWMTHLRIGDLVLEAIGAPWLDPLSFAFGSVAPDCGIALPDGRHEPSKIATHYGHSGDRDYARFARENFADTSDDRAYSFFLGCYLHIIADAAWVKGVHRSRFLAFRDGFASDAAYNAAAKAEWDVLDFRFLRESGPPRLLGALMAADAAPILACPFAPPAALEARFARAAEKYRGPGPADVPTRFLTKEALDGFVEGFAGRVRAGMRGAKEEVWRGWHASAGNQE
jgi:hypothetical protein